MDSIGQDILIGFIQDVMKVFAASLSDKKHRIIKILCIFNGPWNLTSCIEIYDI